MTINERSHAPDPTVLEAYPVEPRTIDITPDPQWQPPVGQPGGKHRAKVAVAGAFVAAVVATAAITAGVVGSGDDSAAATTAAAGPGGGQAMGGQGQGQGTTGRGGGMSAALHGSSVVPDGNGGYVTQETQTGTVSAVSAEAISVKSEDGYTRTYALSSATTVDAGQSQISDVAAGHTVRVVATAAGDSATATAVTDSDLATTTQDQQGGGGPGGGGPQQGGTQQQGTTAQSGTTGT